MGKKQGSKKTGGRTKGVPNKRTKELCDILSSKGYDPVAELIRVSKLAEKEYDRADEIFDKIQDDRAKAEMMPLYTEPKCDVYLKIMQSSASDIMQYVHAKRKALDANIKTEDAPLVVVYKTEWGSMNEGADDDDTTSPASSG